jgi:xanthine dehydrogenase YagR molybdenum-binding subunit
MSTTLERGATATHVGRPLDRIDGRAKVTGAARYAADAPVGDLLYAVIVQSTVARGRIAEIDEAATRAVSGVVEVLTYRNAPKVPAFAFDFTLPIAEQVAPLQSDEIHYDGQHVALVIAETFEAAREGAALLRITYVPGPFQATVDGAHDVESPEQFFGNPMQIRRGDPDAAFAASDVTVDATYVTPIENHNPLEPSATVAQWRDGELTVHDASQWVLGARAAYAKTFSVDETQVRVVAPYLGGGFGCKGFYWAHQTLAAMAAKVTGRAVKLVLNREQMFTSVGYRSSTRQRVRLGASRDGTLRALLHDVQSESARIGSFFEPAGIATPMLFAAPTLSMSHRVAKLDLPSSTAMRAPGEAPGTFALGSAMDELAYACGLDPIDVLRRNETSTDAESGLPFSSRHLLACYDRGAEAFGWSARTHAPRSMRDGGELIGWGVAAATYPALRSRGEARVTIDAGGTIDVASATHDLGTGMYTILAQIAADALGADPRAIRVRIGDSAFPLAPVAGGSMSSATIGPAVHAAAERVYREAVAIATSAGASPLHGLRADEIEAVDGILRAKDDPSRAIAYGEIVRLGALRQAQDDTYKLEALGISEPGKEGEEYSFHSFGAQFVEVRYDEEIARLRVTRALGVFDCGRVLNPKTARSQMIGGITWGIGMALLEETVRDDRYGAVVTNNFADYHVPVNADVHTIDVLFVEEPDLRFNPLGVRGMGEIGITGVAAAIANAVYHATGVRVRDLPIVPEKLLAAQGAV